MSNGIHNSPRVSPVSSAPVGASNYIARASCCGGRYGEGFSVSKKPSHLALESHAGGGTRTPDTRMADTQGSDSSAADPQARQGALSSDELSELGARSGARRKKKQRRER